jgi:hypothetical protein
MSAAAGTLNTSPSTAMNIEFLKQFLQRMQQPGVHILQMEHEPDCPGGRQGGRGCICDPEPRLLTDEEFFAAQTSNKKGSKK